MSSHYSLLYYLWTQPCYSWYLKDYDAAIRISIASLNIRSGRVGGLEAALQVMRQGNVNVDVFQETKLTDGVHAHHGAGTPSGQQLQRVGIGGGVKVG